MAADVISDPVQLLQQLSAEAIRKRLLDLDKERRALMVLLRAAIATEDKQRKGAAHAS